MGEGLGVLTRRLAAGEAEMTMPWTTLVYPEHLSASVRDLWSRKDLGKFRRKFSAKVGSHDVVVVTVRP